MPAVRPFEKLMALSKRKCVEGQAQAPSEVEGIRGSGSAGSPSRALSRETDEVTGFPPGAGRGFATVSRTCMDCSYRRARMGEMQGQNPEEYRLVTS